VLGVGASAAFGIDAATFLLSAAFLSRLRPRQRGIPAVTARRATVWREVRDGFEEVRSRAWVWVTLAAFCVALFFAFAPWAVLGPSVAREQYGGIGIYGLMAAALGAGTIGGSLIGIWWRPRYPMRLAMLFILLWPAAVLLFAAGVTLFIVVPAIVIAGAGIALFDVWWLTALAERIPPDKLSRVTSYDWMVSLGLMPLGYLLAGPLAAEFGSTEVLLAGSALGLLALALGLLPAETRSLERLGDEPAQEFHPRR
jgi:MFS family permease